MLHKQEHGRFKNIEWTAYETVHKKYLSLGMYYYCLLHTSAKKYNRLTYYHPKQKYMVKLSERKQYINI